MATIRIPILNWPAIPDDSEEMFFEPFSVKATNDVWKRIVAIFNDSATRNGLHGGFVVPKDYVDSANIIIVWTSTATAGNVEWDFDYRAVGGNDTESLDQSGTQETVNVADAAPTAALRRLEVALALTDANLAADDEVEFTLFRDGTDAGDTMAASAILFSLLFEYADA